MLKNIAILVIASEIDPQNYASRLTCIHLLLLSFWTENMSWWQKAGSLAALCDRCGASYMWRWTLRIYGTASLLESWLITSKTWCQVRFLLCVYPCCHSSLWVCSGSHLKFGGLALKRQNHKSGLSIYYRYSKLNFVLNYKMLYAWMPWRFAMATGMLE